MKKKVSIFVAGSKELKMERYGLKALAQDLNTRYNEHNIDVFVEMKSYEDFKDKQTEYNHYISQTSDMALFVIDGGIGKFTRNELITAADAYKLKKIPEIVVFLKNFKEETEGVKDVLNLLRDQFGEHFFYVNYDDVADLKFKAETRITRFISPTDYVRSSKKWKISTVLVSVALLLLAGLLFFSPFKKSPTANNYHWDSEEPMLLFLGGGSVVKYLQLNTGVNIKHLDGFPNSIYMGVPTGNLWHMIGEEYFKTDSVEHQNFYPVFLAANAIDIETTKEAIDPGGDILNKILIFELFLGRDTLKVFIGNKWLENLKGTKDYYTNGKNSLSPDQLRNQISEALNSYNLYTTSPNSGTLKSYDKVVGKIDSRTLKEIVSDPQSLHKIFNEQTPIEDPNYLLILGSNSYFPKGLEKMVNYRAYNVRDANDSIVYKNLYIYFVGYKNMDSNSPSYGKYRIPSQVVKFLEKLSLDKKCWGDIKNKEPFVEDMMDSYPEDGVVHLSLKK